LNRESEWNRETERQNMTEIETDTEKMTERGKESGTGTGIEIGDLEKTVSKELFSNLTIGRS
jgi:hypothetical protein